MTNTHVVDAMSWSRGASGRLPARPISRSDPDLREMLSGQSSGTAAALFRASRHALGLSQAELARRLRVQSDRTIRRWEAAERDIPGPAWVALGYMLREAKQSELAETIARGLCRAS